jgi:hypothetical protein
MKIPKEFWNGDNHPEAYTVGALIVQLKRLPENLTVKHGFGAGMQIIVYNHGENDMHLGIEEIDA